MNKENYKIGIDDYKGEPGSSYNISKEYSNGKILVQYTTNLL